MPKIAAPILYLWLSSLIFALSAVTGCVVVAPPPYEEFTIARAAVHAAQEVDSAQYATGLWNKAEENFRSGEKAWKDSEFEVAAKYFARATQFAERAENATKLKKFQTGESLP